MNLSGLLEFLKMFFKKQDSGGQVPEAPKEPHEPDVPEKPEYQTVDTWDAGISDDPRHSGEVWIMPDSRWRGRIVSLKVGDTPFYLQGPYRSSELWYGDAAQGHITAVLQDDSRLVSRKALQLAPTAPDGTESTPLKYHRRTNSERPTYYTYSERLLKVGDTVRFKVGSIDETVTCVRRANGSIGFPYNSGGSSQLLIKNSDVRGRGICVLTPSSEDEDLPGFVQFL